MTTLLVLIFFFFQAEDGIRDKLVTGVQTCALPISFPQTSNSPTPISTLVPRTLLHCSTNGIASTPYEARRASRSEEHTSELQSLAYLVCRLLLEKKKKKTSTYTICMEIDATNVTRIAHP